MKNRILKIYPQSIFKSSTKEIIHIADFTQRTGQKYGVEVHETKPQVPGKQEYMDCLTLKNTPTISLDFNIFDDNQFKANDQKDIEHCECCIFPTSNGERTWITFIEIKDCKIKNISIYKDKVKEQIIATVKQFTQHKIIQKQRIYGVISFPRKKVAFDDTIFQDYNEYKQLYKTEKIHFIATNEIEVIDNYTIGLTSI